MTYTYDLASTDPLLALIARVRLYTNDKDMTSVADETPSEERSAIWTDEEIAVFLADEAEDPHLAAADLLENLASNPQLFVAVRKIGLTWVNYGALREDLLKLAQAQRAIAFGTNVPADGYAEQVYTDFGMRQSITNSVLRRPT